MIVRGKKRRDSAREREAGGRSARLLAVATVLLLAAWAGACDTAERPIPVLDGPIVRSATEDGSLRVEGTVTNLGTVPADYLKAVIRVQDSDGDDLAQTSALVQASPGPDSSGSTLYPYETASFAVHVDVDASRAGKVAVRFEYQTPRTVALPASSTR